MENPDPSKIKRRSIRAAVRDHRGSAGLDSAVDRVQLIQQLYSAGLPSRKILEMLPCVVSGEVTPDLLDRLSAERDRIDAQIGDLTRARDRLDSVIATARNPDLPCRRVDDPTPA